MYDMLGDDGKHNSFWARAPKFETEQLLGFLAFFFHHANLLQRETKSMTGPGMGIIGTPTMLSLLFHVIPEGNATCKEHVAAQLSYSHVPGHDPPSSLF